MTELWETFELDPVPEVSALDRVTYESQYRGSSPVIVRGGAAEMPAVARWDARYLAKTVGKAPVTVASYYADRRDYGSIRSDKTTLAEFLADLQSGPGDEVRYLFNNASCIFVRNERKPDFKVGWAAHWNPALAPLAEDFRVPEFIDPDLFVLAVIILGSQENATDLHYDHGGEGKVLVQIAGRKRLLLLPPSSAEQLELNTLFRRPDEPVTRTGSRPQVDVHAAPDGNAPRLRGYVAELAPGDIAYWPPFWFHDIANLEPYTLAAGIMVDEVRVPALLMRHLSHGVYRALVGVARTTASDGDGDGGEIDGRLKVTLDGAEIDTLAGLFRRLEEQLLAEARRGTVQLWEWNERLR